MYSFHIPLKYHLISTQPPTNRHGRKTAAPKKTKKSPLANNAVPEGCAHPVLVRRVKEVSGGDLMDLVRLSNTDDKKDKKVYEQALDDADAVRRAGIAGLYAPDADGYALEAESAEFLARFPDAVGDRSMLDSALNWTDAGHERARRAMFALAVGRGEHPKELTRLYLEQSRSAGLARAAAGILQAAADVDRLNSGGDAAYSLAEPLARAAWEYAQWRARRREQKRRNPNSRETDAESLAAYLAQREISGVGSEADPFEKALVRLLADPSGERIGRALRGYCSAAMAASGPSLFGEDSKPAREDLLADAFARAAQPAYSVGGLSPDVSRLRTAAEIDSQDGTQLSEVVRLASAIETNDERVKSELAGKHFRFAKTSDTLKECGLDGGHFSIRAGVILRHSGKDAAHNISPVEWVDIADALSRKTPLLVEKRDNREASFRIWVRATISGRPAVVGADVKNAGRDMFVNAIATAFGAENINPKGSNIVYPKSEEEIRSVLTRLNSGRYPESPQRPRNIAQTGGEVKGASGKTGEIPFDTPEQNPDIRFSVGGIYTGSAADYEKPSLHDIGNGFVVYGHGYEGTTLRKVAERDPHYKKWKNLYKQTFFTNRAPGDESHLLEVHGDVTAEQIHWVAEELNKSLAADGEKWEANDNNLVRTDAKGKLTFGPFKGGRLYSFVLGQVQKRQGSDLQDTARLTSELFVRAGIDGIKSPEIIYGKTSDNDKRGWNYVSFRDDNIRVDHKWRDGDQLYSVGGLSAEGLRQYDAVVARYTNPDGTKKPGWMKAPNGSPTNLTERQWVQVRTPAFKAWFGDWEKAFYTRGWRNVRSAAEVLALPVADISAFAPLRDKDAIKAAFQGFGIVRNADDGLEVRFPSNAAGRFVYVRRHAAAFKKLFETSIRAWSEGETKFEGHKEHRNIEEYHHYVNRFKAADGEYFVRFTVRSGKESAAEGTHLVHAANVSDVSIYKNEAAQTEYSDRSATSFSGNGDSTPKRDNKLSYFLGGVNGKKSVSSKIVDENGEPLVAWHGTTNSEETETWNGRTKTFDISRRPFTVFKRRADGARNSGFFFASDRDNAGGYGSTQYAAFLDLRSPLVIDCNNFDYSAIPHNGETRDTYGWAQWAEKNGYDGVVFRNIRDGVDYGAMRRPVDEFVAFESNQIKSATDNSGGFSGENPDIRYSVAPEGYEPAKTYRGVTGRYLYKTMRVVGGHLEFPMAGTGVEVPVGRWLVADDNSAVNPRTGRRETKLRFGSKDIGRDGRPKSNSGTAAPFPGFHMGSLPYMAHIGLGGTPAQKHFQNADYVWVEVDVPMDRTGEYEDEIGGRDPDAVMRGRIPDGGMYWRKTNPNMTGKWGVAGQMKIVRVLSDDDVDAILDRELPGRVRMGRQGGGRFNAATMSFDGQDLAGWSLAEAERGFSADPDINYSVGGLPPREAEAARTARAGAMELLRGVGGTALGWHLNRSFRESGRANLIGGRVGSPGDLAALAQVYRDPRFETFRYFFARGGEVVWQTGVTARMPGVTPAETRDTENGPGLWREVARMAARLRPDSCWLLHNHPSGSTAPSREDMRMTPRVREKLALFGVRLAGHVILDHGSYRVLGPDGSDLGEERLPAGTPSPYGEPRPAAPRFREPGAALTPQVAADFAAGLRRAASEPGAALTLISVDPRGERVSAVAAVPSAAVADPGFAAAWGSASGAGSLFVVGDRELWEYPAATVSAVEAGIGRGEIADFVWYGPGFGSAGSARATGMAEYRADLDRALAERTETVDDGQPRYSVASRSLDWDALPNLAATVAAPTSVGNLTGARTTAQKAERARHAALVAEARRAPAAYLRDAALRRAAKLARRLAASPADRDLGLYLLAKYHGDDEAALRTVRRVLKPGALAEIRAALDPSRPAVAVFPLTVAEGRPANRLPHAYANILARTLGCAVQDAALLKVSGEANTGASQEDRAGRDYAFDVSSADLSGNPQVILVDDVWTSGQTLASALDALLRARPGADVRVLAALAASRYGKNVKPTAKQLTAVLEKCSIPDIEALNREIGFDIRKATGSEIQLYRLSGKPGPAGLRELFATADPGADGGIREARRGSPADRRRHEADAGRAGVGGVAQEPLAIPTEGVARSRYSVGGGTIKNAPFLGLFLYIHPFLCHEH